MPATPYASLADLANTIQPYALTPVATPLQQAMLQRAADRMDDSLNSQLKLPLVWWSTSLNSINCDLAIYMCLKARGFSPKAGADKSIKDFYDLALKWLEDVQNSKIHPVVVESSSGANPPMRMEGSGFAVSVGAPFNSSSGMTRGWVPGNYGPGFGAGSGPYGGGP